MSILDARSVGATANPSGGVGLTGTRFKFKVGQFAVVCRVQLDLVTGDGDVDGSGNTIAVWAEGIPIEMVTFRGWMIEGTEDELEHFGKTGEAAQNVVMLFDATTSRQGVLKINAYNISPARNREAIPVSLSGYFQDRLAAVP